jgi:glycosyltransferase involved in cell wall biosynthesis
LEGARRVCSVGVFIPSYGFLHAAQAIERLRRETGEDIRLLLLDGTFARDEDYRREVLAGRDWITVAENVPNPQVYQVFGRSDCFVRAFGQESYGISRVEALWCGLPVVATTAGETRGMLTYEFGDLDELALQLRRALFERRASETEHWATEFRREAEENLRALREVLGID